MRSLVWGVSLVVINYSIFYLFGMTEMNRFPEILFLLGTIGSIMNFRQRHDGWDLRLTDLMLSIIAGGALVITHKMAHRLWSEFLPILSLVVIITSIGITLNSLHHQIRDDPSSW